MERRPGITGWRRRAVFLGEFALAVALWVLAGAATALARTDVVPTEEKSGVSIKITCPFDPLPPTGYAPFEVQISNRTRQRQTWSIEFSSRSWNGYESNTTSSEELSVEPGAERVFPISVPLGTPGSPLSYVLSGPGLTSSRGWGGGVTIGYQLGSPPSPSFVGVSSNLAWALTALAPERKDHSYTSVTPGELPEDWRALSGFDALVLSGSDLGLLSAAQRTALQEWLAQGGQLLLLDTPEWPRFLAEEGFGKVILLAGHEPTQNFLATLQKLPLPRIRWFEAAYRSTWKAANQIGQVRPNVPLITTLLLVLAVAIGPFNLYWLAGRNRRTRLLWTTPAIALVASAVLIVFILLQDGVGGHGARYAVICLLPGQSKAAIRQEEVSRTGVLFSGNFTVPNASLVIPITPAGLGVQGRRTYEIDGQSYHGDWYSSRSRQGLWLQTVVPTRAEVRLLNGAAVAADGAAPEIVSSIDTNLSELYYWGEDGRRWWAQDLHTGERRKLNPIAAVPETLLPEAGLRLREASQLANNRRGFFAAAADNPASFQRTLKGLRWDGGERAVYLGQVSQTQP